MKKFYISAAVLVLLFTAGCGNKAPVREQAGEKPRQEKEKGYALDTSPAYGDSFIESSIADAVILNPILYTDSPSGNIISLIFNGLVRRNQDLELVGDLARAWEYSEDKLLLTFYLKEGVKWHDGEDFTAHDVKFTYDMIMAPDTKSPSKKSFDLVKNLTAVDDYTVRVEYEKPYAPALNRWMKSIIPKHIFETENINESKYNRQPIGTGPYMFLEWAPDQQIVLEAFDDYFDGRPYFDRYICKVIPDKSMQFLLFQQGEIDLMGLTADQYIKKARTETFQNKFNVFVYPSTASYSYLSFNMLREKYADINVRHAIAMAINRQEIIDEVLYSYGQILTGPFAPSDWAYDQTVDPFPFDPEQARNLLAEAGWTDSDGDGFLDQNGTPFEIELSTNNGNETRRLVANLVQSHLSEVGIKVTLNFVEWGVFMDMCDYKTYDSLIMGWNLGRDPDHYGIWHSSEIPDMDKNKNGNNFMSYINHEADSLWELGRTTFDQDRRREIYHRLHRIIHDDCPYVFLYVSQNIIAVDKRIHGIKIEPSGIFYNFEKWYVPRDLQKY